MVRTITTAGTPSEGKSAAREDFATAGLAPKDGARATEIAAVIVQDSKIVGRYQSLMNAGVTVLPL